MAMKIANEMRYILWYGEKVLAGDTPTEGETARMFEYREKTKSMARIMFRLKPEDYAYTPGQNFQD
jgi:hypothetical protein